MECPKCGEDNLLGAKVCMSCGAKMSFEFAAPPPTAAPPPAEPAAPSGTVTVICPLCNETFHRDKDDDQAACDKCRRGFESAAAAPAQTFDPGGGSGSGSGSRVKPGELDAPGSHSAPTGWGGANADEQFGELLGTATRRPPPIKKVKTFRWGCVLTPLILIGAAAGGWFYLNKMDRTRALLDEMKPHTADLSIAPKDEITAGLETRSRLHIYYGSKRGTFSEDLDAIVDVKQRVLQATGVTLIRVGASGPVVSIRSQVTLEDQTGTREGKPASGDNIHPHENHEGAERIVLSLTGPPTLSSGEPALVGRDVPPFSTVGTLGRPTPSLAAGDTWTASVPLPFLANLRGTLIVAPFRCEFTYVGRGVRGGREVLGIHVVAEPPSTPPGALSKLDSCTGQVRAALFFDANTGLLAEATYDVDVTVLSAGEREARLSVTGTVTTKTR